MKNGKAVVPHDITDEAWIVLGFTGATLLLGFLGNIIISGKMPNKWRNSTLITIFKNKGGIQER